RPKEGHPATTPSATPITMSTHRRIASDADEANANRLNGSCSLEDSNVAVLREGAREGEGLQGWPGHQPVKEAANGPDRSMEPDRTKGPKPAAELASAGRQKVATPVGMRANHASNHSAGKWLIAPDPNPEAKVRLFCFPHAGGGV